jgi:hypothetical protein
VAIDPSKVKDVLEWEQPKNVKDSGVFLDLRDITVGSLRTSQKSPSL